MRTALAFFLLLTAGLTAQRRDANPLTDADAFPIAVWLQAPHNAKAYRDIGINLYVGLYQGPTKEQLAALDRAGMPVICKQNDVGLAWPEPTIAAWMHGDEPDNAQAKKGGGYGPPVAPAVIVEQYEALKKKDRRPVLLNLGQGAAWDGWHGRGARTNHPEDYPQYAKGCDIASFDIYPVTHRHRDVRGRLEFVGNGVRRLRNWTREQKPVWACIETGHVDNADVRPTPEQVRAEVWQAIACGADGIIYFCHEFRPKFVEAGLLKHDDVRAGVAKLNAEVQQFAAVLASERQPELATVDGEHADDVVLRVHRQGGSTYLFFASMTDRPIAFDLRVKSQPKPIRVELPAYGVGQRRVRG